jgi:hypothetical protein
MGDQLAVEAGVFDSLLDLSLVGLGALPSVFVLSVLVLVSDFESLLDDSLPFDSFESDPDFPALTRESVL